MVCRRKLLPSLLDCDEIARGASREECLKYPELQLVSCRGCHQKTQHLKPEHRIAILIAFQIDNLCELYNRLTGSAQTHITRTEVLDYLKTRSVA